MGAVVLEPLSFEEASSNGLFHSDVALGKYPRHSRNLCLSLSKSPQRSCREYGKIHCFFCSCVLFFFVSIFCLFFSTRVANYICCILLKKVPFTLKKKLLISLFVIAKKHCRSIPETKS